MKILSFQLSPENFLTRLFINGEKISLEKLTELEETIYTEESVEPLAAILHHREVPFALISGRMVLKVKKARIISLEKWRMPLTEQVLEALVKEFGRNGELDPAVGISVARAISRKLSIQPMKIQRDEAVLLTSQWEDEYFPAYRAGIISRIARSGELVKGITSYDISSAYPAALIEGVYPTEESKELSSEEVAKLKIQANGTITGVQGFIGLFKLSLVRKEGITLSPLELAEASGHYFTLASHDRVGLVAGSVSIAATLPELMAIAATYDIRSYSIERIFTHSLGKISRSVSELIQAMYEKKKQDATAKIFLNCIAGIAGRSPLKEVKQLDSEDDVTKAVDTYNGVGRRFASSMGVQRKLDQRQAAYMVSWTRLKMIVAAKKLAEVGAAVVYADTDSLKLVGATADIAKVFTNLNSAIADKVGTSGIGSWKDESEEYAGGAIFYEKRFYVKQDSAGVIHSTFAGCDKAKTNEMLRSYYVDIQEMKGEVVPVHQARWRLVKSGETVLPQLIYRVFGIGG